MKTRHKDIKIENIPEFSKKAIILLEDKSFYTNIWIDFSAIARAFISNIKTWEIVEWASTISTQIIRNNFWLNEKRTYKKKLWEFYLALVINAKYKKDEILEYYLNNIYFWNLNYWIETASEYYFWRDINNLTKAEQIALLVIPKNSNTYDPYKNRANFDKRFKNITDYLYKQWLINDSDYVFIKNEKIEFNYDHKNKLPYIKDFITANLKNNKEKDIYTTIDYDLTKKINQLAQNTIIPLAWKDVWDYGIIIIDRKTNELKVMIWWKDYYMEDWQVNVAISKRQAWSTIKPFTYVLSFKDLWYSPSSKVIDLPIQFETKDWNIYAPKNYSLDYKWEVTIAEALSQSINIPAIKTLNEVWIDRLYNFLKEIWITSLDKDPDYYGLALTLWAWEISLYELSRAYSIFANDWDFCDIKYLKDKNNDFEKWVSCKNVIEKKYTDMIYEILTNRYFKLWWFPVNSSLDFQDREVFVKTWTSRNFRDNWTIWFTANYIIWVWAWNKDWTNMKWVSWASWAWEIFRKIVYELEPNEQKNDKVINLENEDTKDYLEIISPLNLSEYKIEENKNKEIKLDFKTNIIYDDFSRYINWNINKDNFFELSKWNFELKLILYKDWEEVWEKISRIEVE